MCQSLPPSPNLPSPFLASSASAQSVDDTSKMKKASPVCGTGGPHNITPIFEGLACFPDEETALHRASSWFLKQVSPGTRQA
ncbi:unnamed protein product [Mesocestoides corti]|uniref:Uncharacterized protein n=1 Tax=Mesocestoides corti TaxID=53468 RepID=A0A0R3UPV0_MESCO|nr:unnamed protein product [Mesocestoides corti]